MIDEKDLSIVRLMEKLTNERENAKKKRRAFAPGVFLTRSERDVLDEVGRYPGIGIKEIASNKGVTPGAVSQMVKLLISRGLLSKQASPESEVRVCIYLTAEGEENYRISEQMHSASFEDWEKILCRLNGKEKESLLLLLEDILEKIRKDEKTKEDQEVTNQ